MTTRYSQQGPAGETPRHRDEQLEGWLRDGWTPQGEQTALCLDAETAAAWADGVLAGAALEQAHVHAATCARCQTLLATLARTADAAALTSASEAEPRRRRWFTWVVPLTAAATAAVALAVWVRTPRPTEPSRARVPSELADVHASKSAAPQVDGRGLAVVPATPSAIDAAGQKSSSILRSEPDASDKSKVAQAQSSDVPRADASNDAREVRSRRLEEAQRQNALGQTTGALVGAADAQRPEPSVPAVATPAPVSLPPASVLVAPALPPPAPPAPAGAARASAPAEAKDAASGPTLFRSVAPLQERVGWTTVVAPDRVAQWRFDASQVQHSTDRGVTWTAVDQIQASQIRAGSAPTASVCWLVGRDGLVLLTTDGSSWNRTPLPAAVDLVSVVATDARTASVTAIDGRQFQTTDGGRTWTIR